MRARPAGFAAADTLRIEAGFVLFANEFRVPVTATEANLAQFAAAAASTSPPELTLVRLQADDRAMQLPWQPARNVIRPAGIGDVAITSACKSSMVDGTLVLGFARTADLESGLALRDPQGEFPNLRRIGLPVYEPGKRRPRLPSVA